MATQIKKEKKKTWDPYMEMSQRKLNAAKKKAENGEKFFNANQAMSDRKTKAEQEKKNKAQFGSAAQRTQKSLGGSLQQVGKTSKGKGSSSSSGSLSGNSSKISNASLKGTTADEANRKKISNVNKLNALTNAYEKAFSRAEETKKKKLNRVR